MAKGWLFLGRNKQSKTEAVNVDNGALEVKTVGNKVLIYSDTNVTITAGSLLRLDNIETPLNNLVISGLWSSLPNNWNLTVNERGFDGNSYFIEEITEPEIGLSNTFKHTQSFFSGRLRLDIRNNDNSDRTLTRFMIGGY